MKRSGQAKKPVSKKFASLIEQLQRKRGVRDLPKRVLIVCEDDKSAPRYFEAIKKHYGLSAASVQVVGSGHSSQPLQVVRKAIEIKTEAAHPESGTEPFGYVWCVIDGDYGEKIANARHKAEAKGVELAISTKCFEYWLLLHFEESASLTHNCDQTVVSLKKHITDYDKGSSDFSKIVGHAREASRRAEELRKPGIARKELPENHNPCSEIYRLVNDLLPEPGS